MPIATSKTREQYPLSTKKILKKTFWSFIIWGIFALITLVLGPVLVPSSGLTMVLMLVLVIVFLSIILLSYLYQRWYFAVYYYELDNDYVVIRKGPITPSEITIPYERIQDVYVDRDLLDRLFGLYDVHISSATSSSEIAAHIDGVEKQAAEGLRTMLLNTVRERISNHRGQNVVPSTPPIPPPSI